MTFTIEQLESLKEGISGSLRRYSTDFRKARSHSVVKNETGAVYAHTGYGADGSPAYKYADLFAASPALLDQLIASERACGRVIELVGKLRSDVYFHGNVGRITILKSLDEILEGRNE